MSRRDQHHARKAAIAGLGRTLSRRAKNKCELCTTSTSLSVIEVPPAPEEPEADRAVMLCSRCEDAVAAKRGVDTDALRFLAESVWSSTLPAQLTAVRLTRRLAADGVTWAQEILEGLYLDEDTEALLAEG